MLSDVFLQHRLQHRRIDAQFSGHLRRDPSWQVQQRIPFLAGKIEHQGHRPSPIDQLTLKILKPTVVSLDENDLVGRTRPQVLVWRGGRQRTTRLGRRRGGIRDGIHTLASAAAWPDRSSPAGSASLLDGAARHAGMGRILPFRHPSHGRAGLRLDPAELLEMPTFRCGYIFLSHRHNVLTRLSTRNAGDCRSRPSTRRAMWRNDPRAHERVENAKRRQRKVAEMRVIQDGCRWVEFCGYRTFFKRAEFADGTVTGH